MFFNGSVYDKVEDKVIVKDLSSSEKLPAKHGRIIQLDEKKEKNAAPQTSANLNKQKNTKPQKFISSLLIPIKQDKKDHSRARGLSYILGAACLIIFTINIIHLGISGLRFKQSIADAASQGFERIINGAMAVSATNFDNAQALFSNAEETFNSIRADTWFISQNVGTLTLRDPTFDAANAVIEAGKHLSAAGINFTTAAKNLNFLPKNFFAANINGFNADTSNLRPSLTEKLKNQLPEITKATKELIAANTEIQKVPMTFVPNNLRDKFGFAKNALSALTSTVSSLENDTPAILALLGDAAPHTFLILLQNNAEIRPSGGFIGNYMIVETNDGYITKSEVFDIYSADHKLDEVLEPPPEIKPINPRFFMRDSNYSGDFPLSAAKAAWFLEKEKGPGVDTVIAIDTSFITKIMSLTGPIKIPEFSLSLTAENFSAIVSYTVEAKIFGKENPKSILKSFMTEILQTLLLRTDPVALVPLLRDAINEKHLLAFSKNPNVQEFFKRSGAAGQMKKLEPKEDYLNIVHTSIGGNKSDDYISETITHDSYLKSDGRVIDEITITRSHEWNTESEKRLREIAKAFGYSEIADKVMEILGKSRNLHMMRIYVPLGATPIESSDPEVTTNIDPETKKTYFSAKMITQVGETSTLRLRYELPFKLNLNPVDRYSLIVQKQAGQQNIEIQKRIFPDSRVMNYKYFPENGTIDSDGILNYEAELNRDLNFTSVWGK